MSRPNDFADRRAFGRRESHIRATIEISGRPPVHCIVRNFSRGGALIELAEPIGIDRDLYLVIASHDFATYCDVRHRSGLSIGVSFFKPIDETNEARFALQTAKELPAEPVTGVELRKALGIGKPEPQPVIVRRYRSTGIIRNP